MRKKGGLIFLFFLFWLLFPRCQFVFAQKFVSPEEAACLRLDKGEIDKAIEILQDTLKKNPNNLNAQLYLGIAFYFKKDLEGAFKVFEKIEKELDRVVGTSRPFGDEVAFTQMGMERKAALLFSKEKKGLLSFFCGLILKEKKELKAAKKKFKDALSQKHDEMAARLQLFDLSLKTEDLESASEQLTELKKISGESELILFLDTCLKYSKGSIEEALAAFGKIASSNLEAKKNMARIHYNSGDYQTAIETWQQVLSQSLDDKEAQLSIGRSYFHLGNLEKAQEYFSKAGFNVPPERLSPKKVPLVYETLLKEVKYDLRCQNQ